jgi:hypothetical protein
MRSKATLSILLFVPFIALAQYEQKLSINLAAGAFKTFGEKTGTYEPMQMPNYQMGFSARGGLQIRLGRHWSIAAEAGLMITQRWYYSETGEYNYMDWIIEDTTTGEVLATGTRYLDLYNYSIGLRPAFYFFDDARLNPYLFAGVNFHYTTCCYEDTQWEKQNELGMLPPDDEGPYNNYLESNSGIGFNPGVGIEYSAGSWIRLFLDAGYNFIALKSENFKSPSMEEDFNAFSLHFGSRFFFIKTRDL